MPSPRASLRLSLQAKVMAVVLSLLVVLPAVTLWLVDKRISAQTRNDGSLALTTASSYFIKSLGNRAEGLSARHRNLTNDSRFQKIVRLGDEATTRAFLRDLLDELADDTVVLALVRSDGTLVAGARRSLSVSIHDVVQAAGTEIDGAQSGGAGARIICVGGRAFNAITIPVVVPETSSAELLLAGVQIGDDALQALKPPHTEVLLVSEGRVMASTLLDSDAASTAIRISSSLKSSADAPVEPVILNGQRFLAQAGEYLQSQARSGLRFVIFSSQEERLLALEKTRRTLLGLSALGILISATVIWFFVRRLTQPLRDLRNSAEAVGRGDFSHRIEKFSNDEVGELAEEFNRMTLNLQGSRAELERAMQMVRNTQHQLIQSEKLSAVGQFVAGVAHELNNPLTAVVGFAELLQMTVHDEKIDGHLNRIAQSAHRCHKIVHSLLSFARQHPPERKMVKMQPVLEEVLEIMAYDLRTSNVTVEKVWAPSLPLVMADAHQLQQVFVNILGNARQAMEPQQRAGHMIIRTRDLGAMIEIEFEDNGPGIQPEHLAKIFDPFFTTKPVGKGTGLGLSLSYGIIQEHGGSISARSEYGAGAVFVITLPVATPTQLQARSSAVRGGSAMPFPGGNTGEVRRKILVVDDELWIMDLASELLTAEGHEVKTAHGGVQAIELLEQHKFDLVVSDWKMPGMNGVRLYEYLLERDPDMAKRVLFMTGDVVSDTFQEFLKTHSLTYVSKPFAIAEFRAAVARLFSQT